MRSSVAAPAVPSKSGLGQAGSDHTSLVAGCESGARVGQSRGVVMSDDVKDAGLVAMISSILGGNKRAEAVMPPPLAELPPTALSSEFDSVAAPIPVAAEREDAPHAAPASVRPTEQIAMTPSGKRRLPAEAI